MSIAYTRAMVRAALAGELSEVQTRTDAIFNVAVPTACPGVPADVLDSRRSWRDGDTYDAQARKLAAMFAANFHAFESEVSADVRAAGPRSV
jgi:phosphoenolpyruvate carboxykinase (ATP)